MIDLKFKSTIVKTLAETLNVVTFEYVDDNLWLATLDSNHNDVIFM